MRLRDVKSTRTAVDAHLLQQILQYEKVVRLVRALVVVILLVAKLKPEEGVAPLLAVCDEFAGL
jgi:hypothetical protein